MDLPPFRLNQWLDHFDFADPPIACNLAGSTGPRWLLRELLAIGGDAPALDGLALGYAPAGGGKALREAIAAVYGVDPDWVVVTNGASEAFSVLLCVCAREGGNVVLPTPAYPAFGGMAQAWRLGVRSYALRREEGFRQSPGQVLAAVDGNSVLAVVNTPHNPSGAIMPRDAVAALAGALGERGVPLLVDEVFHPIYHGEVLPSAVGIGNAIVVGDMSKALSMPGLRIGWIIDADARRRERLVTARSYFSLSGSPLLEALATHAMRHQAAIVARAQSVATANLALLTAFMAEVDGILSWVPPPGGVLAYPWFDDLRASRPWCEAMAARGVLIAPGDCFGQAEHMRIGFGAREPDELAAALDAMRSALHEA